MATLTRQIPTEAGVVATYSTATLAGDKFKNTGHEILHIVNGGASPATVTVPAQVTSADNEIFGDLNKTDAEITVAAGAEAFLGPFAMTAFNSNGYANITYDQVTSLTVAVISI